MSFSNDFVCGTFTEVFNSKQSVNDTTINNIKYFVRTVDIWWVDFKSHATTFCNVNRKFINTGNFVCKVGCDKFCWIICFKISCFVCNNRVGCSVTFVKSVTCKWNHDIKNIFCVFCVKSVFNSTIYEVYFFCIHNFFFLFSHSTTEHIRTTKRISCNSLSNLHNLFLVNHNSVSFFENIFKTRVWITNCFWMPLSFDVLRNIIHRSWTIKCVQSNQLFDTTRLKLLHNFLHSRAFKLENRYRFTFTKHIESFFIVIRNIICCKIF